MLQLTWKDGISSPDHRNLRFGPFNPIVLAKKKKKKKKKKSLDIYKKYYNNLKIGVSVSTR